MPPEPVDAVHGHLGADQRRLAAGCRRARQRLERADLVGLGLAKGASPRRGHQHRSPEGARGRRAEPEQPAAGDLAAVPEVLRPLLVGPVLRHREFLLVIRYLQIVDPGAVTPRVKRFHEDSRCPFGGLLGARSHRPSAWHFHGVRPSRKLVTRTRPPPFQILPGCHIPPGTSVGQTRLGLACRPRSCGQTGSLVEPCRCRRVGGSLYPICPFLYMI